MIALGGGEKGELHAISRQVRAAGTEPEIWGEFGAVMLPESNAFFYIQMMPQPEGKIRG